MRQSAASPSLARLRLATIGLALAGSLALGTSAAVAKHTSAAVAQLVDPAVLHPDLAQTAAIAQKLAEAQAPSAPFAGMTTHGTKTGPAGAGAAPTASAPANNDLVRNLCW
jgi:hypothetical protein